MIQLLFILILQEPVEFMQGPNMAPPEPTPIGKQIMGLVAFAAGIILAIQHGRRQKNKNR